MNRSFVRRLLALGLLVPSLSAGCGSDESPKEDTPSADAGTPDGGGSGTPDGGGSGTPDGGGALSQFAQDMLDGHNATRASARPTPSPALAPVTWDTAAENTAKAYAEKCEFKHNANRGNLGENLYAATPSAKSTRDVVQGWSDEIADYDYANNACPQGKMCGHYTQIVWRDTKRIGCATQTCTKNSPFGAQWPTWQLWVCNYAPPGNYVGQRPY